MTSQGAALQVYNNELVKCIENLNLRRDTIQREIIEEENEKNKLQNDIRLLSENLSKIVQSLAQKIQLRNELDKTLTETQKAYDTILDTSKSLLNNVRTELQKPEREGDRKQM